MLFLVVPRGASPSHERQGLLRGCGRGMDPEPERLPSLVVLGFHKAAPTHEGRCLLRGWVLRNSMPSLDGCQLPRLGMHPPGPTPQQAVIPLSKEQALL